MRKTLVKKIKFFLSFLSSFLLYSECLAHPIEVQGHRGSRGTTPENTLPGFDAAIQAGADVLELDLHLSADGIIFIHHHFFTRSDLCKYKDGTPLKKKSLLNSWTIEEIKMLDCGSKTDPKFPQQIAIPGTEIPTLEELFNWIRSSSHPNAKHIRLNLELKRDARHPEYSGDPHEFAKKLLHLVKKNEFSKRVYYSSFDPEVLKHLRKLDPNAMIGFIYDSKTIANKEQLNQLIASLNPQILSPDHSLLNSAKDVQHFKKMGIRVIPWTVNEPKRWQELIQMGVDGLITDYPAQLIQFLRVKEECLLRPFHTKREEH